MHDQVASRGRILGRHAALKGNRVAEPEYRIAMSPLGVQKF